MTYKVVFRDIYKVVFRDYHFENKIFQRDNMNLEDNYFCTLNTENIRNNFVFKMVRLVKSSHYSYFEKRIEIRYFSPIKRC